MWKLLLIVLAGVSSGVPHRAWATPAGTGERSTPASALALDEPGLLSEAGTTASYQLTRHLYLQRTDGEYRHALTVRRVGTGVAIVGGAIGSVLLMIGLAQDAPSFSFGVGASSARHDSSKVVPWAIAALVVTGCSVAVGVPIAVIAHSKVNDIRARYDQQQRSALPPARTASLSWQF